MYNLNDQFAVISLPLGPIDTNTHILMDVQKQGKALIIDAPLDSLLAHQEILHEYHLHAQALFLTHGHWDHMGGAAKLAHTLKLQIWAGRNDELLLQNPQIMRAFSGDFDIPPVAADHLLPLQFTLVANTEAEHRCMPLHLNSWPELEIMVYAMPGHTAGGVAYYFPQANCVMTGDQLFRASVGRSDFPGGDFSLLQASIQESLYTLPGETVVFPGHGPETQIAEEMQNNPFVRP